MSTKSSQVEAMLQTAVDECIAEKPLAKAIEDPKPAEVIDFSSDVNAVEALLKQNKANRQRQVDRQSASKNGASPQEKMDKVRHETLKVIADERAAQLAEMELARSEGRKPRVLATTQWNTFYDPSSPTLPDGTKLGDPQKLQRWASLRDPDGNPDTADTALLLQSGYEPVINPATGKPHVDGRGLLIECDPEVEGIRQAQYAKSTTDLSRFQTGAATDGSIRDISVEGMNSRGTTSEPEAFAGIS